MRLPPLVHRGTRYTLSAVLMCALFCVPSRAHTTTVQSVTLEQLARSSDHVVLATAVNATSRWMDATHLVTDITMDTVQSVRGALRAGERFTLTLAGGVLGNVGQTVPGVTTPRVGRTYLLFLVNGDTPSTLWTTHLTASVLAVTAGIVRPPVEGLSSVSMNTSGVLLVPLLTRVREVR